ncbi:acetate--CoA ligase family protein [Nocardia asteroides]|uniref:acetate--CoA ligase family protein n=1 Tax=Nocardia asteroides TaxID=1824 RepID=UPI003416EA32
MLLHYDTLARCLAEAGVPLVRERLVENTQAAVAAAEEFGVPVVLKLISPALVHKADVGAVVLDLVGAEAVRAAAERLTTLAAELALESAGWQILVQEMVRGGGTEVFVGIKRDETFGHVVIVGAGGSLVELLPDRALARCPIDTAQAAALLRSTTIGTVLGGYRGQRDVVDDVAAVVAAASRLPAVRPDLAEADLNPLVITPSGPIVVDARLAVDDIAEEVPDTAVPATELDLRALLEPSSVLVVGASASGAVMPGNLVLRYLRAHGYAGRVVVAHPKATEVDGYPAVAKITDLEHGAIDLVCVAVPAASCAGVLDDCGRIGVPAAVVLSSGFSEVGNDELEAELAAVATRHGIAMCGPNTVGLMSPGTRAHVCFSQAQSMASIPTTGRVALVAQSGALGGSLASQAWERGIGISRFVSVGNQATLGTSDYLRHLAGDPQTDTIAVVLEGVGDGGALLDAVATVTAAGKRVFVLKVGRTEAGARAVQSHTGSVAGDYTVYRALLTGAGAVAVDTITELLDALALRDAGHRLPPTARIGIVSTSGGACSMIADLCDQYGFTVPTFSADLRARLGEILPSFAAIANPVDVTGRVATEPAIYGRALAAILASDEVDAVTVLVTTVADPMAEEIAREVARQVAATDKPVIVSWTIAAELAPRGLGLLRAAGIPVFDDPARAIHAAHLVK